MASKAKTLIDVRVGLTQLFESAGMSPDQPHIIIGGCAMFAQDLRETFEDVDVIIPGIARAVEVWNGIPFDMDGILREQGGDDLGFEMMFEYSLKRHGLCFMRPEHIRRVKRKSGRKKDKADLLVLTKHIESQPMANPFFRDDP